MYVGYLYLYLYPIFYYDVGGLSRLTLAQQELVMYTEKMTKQTQQISDYEYEISLLRKQLESLETEREKDKKKISELEELLAKAREVDSSISSLFLSSSSSSSSCLYSHKAAIKIQQNTNASQKKHTQHKENVKNKNT